MLSDALKYVKEALRAYIVDVEKPNDNPKIIELGNIALAEELGGSNNQEEPIVMSLVNLQEETALKNTPRYRQENGRVVYKHPPVSLNLFVLFSVLHQDYETSLKMLSRVVEFFQWKKEFSFLTTPLESETISREIKLYADLYTLTFEQLNHLWGALGGKQVPFVLYKFRLVALEAQKQQAEGPLITEVSINE